MKLNLFTPALILFGLLGSVFSAQPSQAQSRFSCNTNYLSTVVNTERGAIPLIRWTDRSFPPPFTPEQRCEIVSGRFRNFDANGTLKYIKADRINNLPVLCVAAYKGGSCLPNGLLVTFKPGTDANAALIKILDRRVWAAGDPIQLCSSNCTSDSERVISQVNGENYVDMELFLNWTENEN
ncbi:MAG: COP23 domain-containing protein [Cyanobacteria bacterium J06623_7]